MLFPDLTICNFNPIRRSYVQGQSILNDYISKHPNFTVDEFYMEAGFDCSEVFKYCSIGGRVFDCCANAEPIRTNFGKCFTLKLQSSDKEWMHRQTEPGASAGIQIILDAHLEEQFGTNKPNDTTQPLFSNGFENGFRYFVHQKDSIPYLVANGISISPDTVAYTAITTNRYVLLPRESWGNCSDEYPQEYAQSDFPYSMANCQSICKAKYFTDNCGCTPSLYNIAETFPECSPFETYICIDQHLRTQTNDSVYYAAPDCSQCKLDCLSTTYQTSNSYGRGLSNGALYWLNRKNSNWSIDHMKENFGIVNIFFSEMTFTEYSQVQATSLTEILSDIGGNMGMFLGMSVITITELSMYFSKLLWIIISKKRREYLYKKKTKEQEHDKKIEEVVTEISLFRSRKEGTGSMSRLKGLVAQHQVQPTSPSELNIAQLAWTEAQQNQSSEIPEIITDDCNPRKMNGGVNEQALAQLRQMHEKLDDYRKEKRSNTGDSGRNPTS
ncbi:hypothetical protein WR25_15114 isoform A [Diploscapter pachys]|uniref:Uncharacterized protein n=1 Tax=Diploscapter pachys TaxID=2018661 RepID=A0A2A2LMF4_9BILA|nr:hypothetical protein WR25_15114 isoform A [Diploscapter pachys]